MKAIFLVLIVFIISGCVQTGGVIEKNTTQSQVTHINETTTSITTTTIITTTTVPPTTTTTMPEATTTTTTTTSTTTSSTTTTMPISFSVIVSTDKEVIVRGNPVIITTYVTDGENPIDSANVYVTITYASGSHIENSGVTSDGVFVWEKTIGGNSKPGTFFIESTANKDGFEGTGTTSFEVVAAS
jgi:hypothetical protein